MENKAVLYEAAKAAAQMLTELKGPSRKQRIKSFVYKMLGKGVRSYDMIFWPAGLLMLGLLEYGDQDPVDAYLKRWIAKGAQFLNTDDALTGYVLHRLSQAGSADYNAYAAHAAAFIEGCPRDKAWSIVYRSTADNEWIYADGAGMTSLFLISYGLDNERYELLRLGMRQIENFFQYGMDAASGLPYHGYDAESGIKYGITGWGRAVGWLLMGMQAYMHVPEDRVEEADTRIFHETKRQIISLVETVLSWQRKDGLYSWQLQLMEGPSDTSCSGMILWSLLRMAATKKLPEELTAKINEMAGRMTPMLRAYIHNGKVYGALAECLDFAQYKQEYGNYAWGQGAAVMALCAAETIGGHHG